MAQTKEERRESNRRWRVANPDKALANGRKWKTENPGKNRASARKWRAANREKRLASHLLYTYGITQEQYAAIESSQGGACAICRLPCGTHQRLSVDHNHATGEVRGLLCSDCNTGIGRLNDSPERLRAAAMYLESFSPPQD